MTKKKTKNIEERIIERSVLEPFAPEEKWCELINVSKLIAAIKEKNTKGFSDLLGEKKAKNPGCYKWWAKKEDIEELLSKKLSVDKKLFSETGFSDLFEEKEGNLYCVYVGKANRLYDRLRAHSKKTEQSTLRRTICSLTCDQDDPLEKINNTVDGWLNKFKVQYFPLYECERTKGKSDEKQTIYKLKGVRLKGEENELSLLDLEYFFINEYFHILNVEENHFAEYREKKGNQLKKETENLIEEILTSLSEEKEKWSKKKILEIKKKNR